MELQILIESQAPQENLEELYYNFLKELENYNLFFGGGINKYGIAGCIDFSKSNLNRNEIVSFLEHYIRTHNDLARIIIADV